MRGKGWRCHGMLATFAASERDLRAAAPVLFARAARSGFKPGTVLLLHLAVVVTQVSAGPAGRSEHRHRAFALGAVQC